MSSFIDIMKRLLGADNPGKKFPNNQTYIGCAILGAAIVIVLLYWWIALMVGLVGAIWLYKSTKRKEVPHESQS